MVAWAGVPQQLRQGGGGFEILNGSPYPRPHTSSRERSTELPLKGLAHLGLSYFTMREAFPRGRPQLPFRVRRHFAARPCPAYVSHAVLLIENGLRTRGEQRKSGPTIGLKLLKALRYGRQRHPTIDRYLAIIGCLSKLIHGRRTTTGSRSGSRRAGRNWI